MIASLKKEIWILAAVATLSAATLAIFCGTAEAQSFATASAPASLEGTQSANQNANTATSTSLPDGATIVRAHDAVFTPSQPTLEPAARLIVKPGDSLWSITQGRLHPSATPEQIMNELGRTFELNRDLIGDDPNLILPGQELLLPAVAEPPTAAAPGVAEPEVAERVPELISEPVVLPDLPEGEAVPEAPEVAESSFESFASYANERWLLGLGIIVLTTLVLGILGARRRFIKRKAGSPTARRTSPAGYSENYTRLDGPGEPSHASAPQSKSLVTPRSPNNLGEEDLTNAYGSNPLRTIDAKTVDTKTTPRCFRVAPPSTRAFEADEVRPDVGGSASAMLLLMAEDKDFYTPPQAARILRLSRQRVTQMLQSGEMEGRQDPKSGRWRIPQRVVHARLKDRPARGHPDDGSPINQPEGSQRLGELELEVRDLNYRLGRSEARLELTEKTESTVRAERDRLLEDLERERQRAERLEAELQEARRPWWRKLFSE